MLIRRCGWHRTYHGYWRLSGVASWRGWTVSFTDGVCPSCTARIRSEGNLPPLEVLEKAVSWSLLGAASPRAAVAFVALVAFVLASRPLDDVRTPQTVTAPPPVALASRTPADQGPPPALAVPSASRRVGRIRGSAVAGRFVPPPLPAISLPVAISLPAAERPADPPPADTPRAIVLALETTRPPVHAGLTIQTP